MHLYFNINKYNFKEEGSSWRIREISEYENCLTIDHFAVWKFMSNSNKNTPLTPYKKLLSVKKKGDVILWLNLSNIQTIVIKKKNISLIFLIILLISESLVWIYKYCIL